MDGQQRARLTAVVQDLQRAAEQQVTLGGHAWPVKQTMAKVLSRVISMEHRCITNQMAFVRALMWDAAEVIPASSLCTAEPTGSQRASALPVVTSEEHGVLLEAPLEWHTGHVGPTAVGLTCACQVWMWMWIHMCWVLGAAASFL